MQIIARLRNSAGQEENGVIVLRFDNKASLEWFIEQLQSRLKDVTDEKRLIDVDTYRGNILIDRPMEYTDVNETFSQKEVPKWHPMT